MVRYDHYIGGASVPPASGEYLPTENPFSGKVWAEIARGNAADARAAVDAAQRAFVSGAWPQLTPSERGRLLWKLGDLVVANAARLAEIEQRDNGKLAAEVVAPGPLHRRLLPLLRRAGRQGRKRRHPDRQEGRVRLHEYEPKGVVAIITPWNSPLTLTSWKLAPALAAGCTAVIKPSEFTSASMLEFAKLFARGGISDRRRQRRHRPRRRGRRGRW